MGRLLPFLGPAFIASIAYMDPGNFATNIQGGAQFGYLLLWVVIASNLMAMLVQSLSAKLGIASGLSLPEMIRQEFPRPLTWALWLLAEVVAMATDLAEFLGAAVGFYLLFGIPLFPAALLTAVVTFAILALQRYGFRLLEAVITAFVGVIGTLLPDRDDPGPAGLRRRARCRAASPLRRDGDGAPGRRHPRRHRHAARHLSPLGADPEPHHRSHTRAEAAHLSLRADRHPDRHGDRRSGQRRDADDGGGNLLGRRAWRSPPRATSSCEAFRTLTPLLGGAASIIFAISLLASGLSSSTVGTMAGQVIMQGFIHRQIPIWLRRLITMLPALVVIAFGIDATRALVLSQVVLSFGIPFALVPLVLFTRRRDLMGELVNRPLTTFAAGAVATLIISLNLFLLYQTFLG